MITTIRWAGGWAATLACQNISWFPLPVLHKLQGTLLCCSEAHTLSQHRLVHRTTALHCAWSNCCTDRIPRNCRKTAVVGDLPCNSLPCLVKFIYIKNVSEALLGSVSEQTQKHCCWQQKKLGWKGDNGRNYSRDDFWKLLPRFTIFQQH